MKFGMSLQYMSAQVKSVSLKEVSVCRTKTIVDEIQNASGVLEDFLEEIDFQKEKETKNGKVISFSSSSGQCPRCDSITKMSSGHPHCLECSWDSLTDLRNQIDRWAA